MDGKTLYDYYNESREQYFNLHQNTLKFSHKPDYLYKKER